MKRCRVRDGGKRARVKEEAGTPGQLLSGLENVYSHPHLPVSHTQTHTHERYAHINHIATTAIYPPTDYHNDRCHGREPKSHSGSPSPP